MTDLYVEFEDGTEPKYIWSTALGKLLVYIEDRKLADKVDYIWNEDSKNVVFKEYNGFWEDITNKPEKIKHFIMAKLGAVNVEDLV
jgi:hypothetical protein